MRIFYPILLLITLLASSCSMQPKLSCDKVNTLHRLCGSDFTEAELIGYLEERSIMPEGKGATDHLMEGASVIHWTVGDVEYHAYLENGVLNYVGIVGADWTIEQLETCLGSPQVYRAVRMTPIGGRSDLNLSVLSPETGVEAYGYEFRRRGKEQAEAQVSEGFRFRVLVVGVPDEIEILMGRTFTGGYNIPVLSKDDYRTWPGSLGDLEYTVGTFTE